MPKLPARVHAGDRGLGGVIGYPLDRLHEEVAFIAYHFHWPHAEIMAMEHADRRRWVQEISAINGQLSSA
jgi:hypothetical protein